MSMPKKLRDELAKDQFYKICIRNNENCSGRITWEHCWTYKNRQIQEKWAIVPLCWAHHLGAYFDKWVGQLVSLRRATPEDLAKYPKKDWAQIRDYLEKKYA